MTKLATQNWLKDSRLTRLFEVLEGAGGEARVAGGAVRNGLWDLPVADIDVATTLLPKAVMTATRQARFGVHPTGVDHGTVTVVVDDLVMEVTTLRADVETDGRRAVVAFSDDWEVDAQRRDFTFNALYCDLNGKVYDETKQGLSDSAARRVRFVGDAEQRIREDFLRILRYFRFEAQYGRAAFDDEAMLACTRLKSGMQNLSAERIQVELFKTLVAPRAVEVIKAMIEQEILQELMVVDGGVEKLALLIEVEEHLKLERDGLRALAVLTSDLSHWRLSKKQQGRFLALKAPIDISPTSQPSEQKKILYELQPDLFRDAVIMAWIASQADGRNKDWADLYHLPEQWTVPVFPLSGKDLLEAGIAPGKEMGAQLKLLERQWVDSGFREQKAGLLKKACDFKK